MKAKTKFQIEILSLTKKLQPLSLAHKKWAIHKCIEHISVCNNKKQITCLHCSFVYTDIMYIDSSSTCPSCNITATKKILTRKRKFADWAIFAIYDTINKMQVIRYFTIHAEYNKGIKAEYFFREVSQLWLKCNGKFEIYANIHQLNYYQNRWIGGFEIRNKRNILKYDIKPYKIYPRIKILNEFRRVKFKLIDSNLSPLATLLRLLKPKFETLYKAQKFNLFNYKSEDTINKYWNSIKICLRNNYSITDESMWFDYLQLLEYFNKDLLNTKYICPINLKAEHDKLVKKKSDIFRKQKLKEQIKKIKDAQIQYEKEKSIFFDIIIQSDDITIQTIKNVKDFFDIGSKHNHCLFSNEYYQKPNSLLLTAKKNEELLETIELSLETFEIIQSRGEANRISSEHDKILSILKQNIDRIKYHKAS